MLIKIITLFPEMFEGVLGESIIKRAREKGLIDIEIHNLRDWAKDKHKTVDDRIYGGGAGMLIKADVVYRALKDMAEIDKEERLQKISNSESLVSNNGVASRPYIVLPTPKGRKFDQKTAYKLAKRKELVFLCPHYEGYDHRIESMVDEKVSLGDFVLTGGEIPVMAMVDSIVRLIPGVIRPESLEEESFSMGIKNKKLKFKNLRISQSGTTYEYPQYTRPEILEVKIDGKKIKKRVPKVLLSGNHALVDQWRKEKSK